MDCRFVVGQKVECIQKVWPGKQNSCPVFGQIYTITAVLVGPFGNGYQDGIGLELKEVVGCEVWEYKGFRPLQERHTETGMAILRKLLDPANHKTLEEV